jgi:PEP-CTERM motif
MRKCMFVLGVCASLNAGLGFAHGPQIQTTRDAGKIVTREIVDEDSYHTALSDPKSVYVMPLAQYLGVWRAQPSNSLLPDGTPEFVGWPGFAYGYGYDATTNPTPFPAGSKFILGFTAGFKSWDGAAFVDAGVSEAEAYRGPSATPSALARTSDVGPFQSLMFPGGEGISFASEGGDTHNVVNYRMLGDGTSTTSALLDGVYLLSLELTSTDASVAASDPFYFVLHKNSAPGAVAAAIDGLGIAPSLVQVVPEPGTWLLATIGIAGLGRSRFVLRRRNWR